MGGNSWPGVAVSEVCELIVDCVNKTAPKVEGPTPYKMIRTTNIRNGRIDLSDCKYVEKDTYEKWTRRASVELGDVLLTREAPIGEVGYVVDDDTIFLGQRIMQYRANPELLDSRFLLYSFLSPNLKHQFGVYEGSGSVVSHIRVGDCSKFKITLPPLSEQQAIAHILGAFDDKIDLNRRMNQTLESMARAIFKSWFVDFDGCTEFQDSELGKIPKGWEVVNLGSAIELAYGKSLPKKKRVPGNYRVYGSGGVTGTHEDYLVEGPGIIVGRKGTVGSVYWEDANFFPIDTTFFVKIIDQTISLHWAYQKFCLMDLASLGADSAVPGVNRNAVYAQKMVLPPASTVERFDEVISSLVAKIRHGNQNTQTLSKLRDTLLPKLISGELRVPDAEKLAGEVL